MLALPALAAIVVYLPALPGGFLSDDYSQLHTFYGADAREVAARVGKTFVSGVGPPSNQYRPLTMASFAANALLNGADAPAWRLVNVALHGANAALVALLSWQLAGSTTRGARAAALAAGLGFAWFAPSAEAVAWISARFDGMALFWMLVAACAFMASRTWRDRYGLASLAATVLAFMSKESAAIGPALIAALAWTKRPERDGLVRGIVRALVAALPWIVIGAAYFAYRTWIFGDPFRFYPGTSPGSDLLSGKWLAVLPASADWWPRVMPEAWPLRVYAIAGLFVGIAAVSAGLADPREGRVLVAVVAAFVAACALLFSHWGWSPNGEGGRVLYALAAIAALAVALPLRSPDSGLRRAAWIVALVLLGSGLMLTRGAVERRAQAGAEVDALIAALAATADAIPSELVRLRRRSGSDRLHSVRAQCAGRPHVAAGAAPVAFAEARRAARRRPSRVGRRCSRTTSSEGSSRSLSKTSLPAPQVPGPAQSLAVPDRFFCWSTKTHKLVAMPLAFAPGYADWNDVWARGLDAAGCRG